MSRHLVTTADERTWDVGQPILFLGEWCRLYERRRVWSTMDAVVAEPYGLSDGQKERDVFAVESVSGRLLLGLVDVLNAFHHTRHGLRYWNILLGPWLKRYVATVFNRYFTLEQALRSYCVRGTTVLSDTTYSLATNDTDGFVRAANDDVWNHVLYSRIIAFLGSVETQTQEVKLSELGRFHKRTAEAAGNDRGSQLRRAAERVLRAFRTDRDAVIAATYLPSLKAAELQASLGQCPQIWAHAPVRGAAFDASQRTKIAVGWNNQTAFEQFTSETLRDALPICYLEGYSQLVDQVASSRWPDKPKFIFTSNRFDTDEAFKAWTGSMVERGVPYFAGQHGSNFGTLLQSRYWPEMTTCDRFFSWGWVNQSPRDVPAFVFRLAGRKSLELTPSGGLLLIQLHPPHRITPWDSYFEFGLYQDEQFRFLETLPAVIRDTVTVRLHAEHRTHRWSDKERWRDHRPETHIDSGVTAISRLIKQSRLVVHSYDSTGMLETLAMNIPTVCYWHSGFSHLLPSARPHYQLLRDAGIFFATPEEAAEHVALHWESLSEWWATAKVQDARERFCERYARTERRPVYKLRKLLLEACARSDGRAGQ